jgi:hypothetical protein
MKVLYSSHELHNAIKDVLGDPQPNDRRVALVAFVGEQAEAFLPEPAGMEIVCWLQPGASHAGTIDRLRKRGVNIFKSERLHMKVYWSSRRGCVICSANASGAALGRGNQKEAGVWLPSQSVNIKRLWSYASPQPITPPDLKRLRRDGERTYRKDDNAGPQVMEGFLEWQESWAQRDWKLGWWYVDAEFADEAVIQAKLSYGDNAPNQLMNGRHNQLRPHDWILTFLLPNSKNMGWMYVDFVTKVSPKDPAFDKDDPFQVIQANSSKSYPPPPFRLDQAFKKAVRHYGIKKIQDIDTLRPPKAFLDLMQEICRCIV